MTPQTGSLAVMPEDTEAPSAVNGGAIARVRLTNAVHVPFACLICASQRQRNSLRNFIWCSCVCVSVCVCCAVELIGNFMRAKVTEGKNCPNELEKVDHAHLA